MKGDGGLRVCRRVWVRISPRGFCPGFLRKEIFLFHLNVLIQVGKIMQLDLRSSHLGFCGQGW